MSKDQAKRLKSQVNDSKRNICDLKAKVRKICFNLVIFLTGLVYQVEVELEQLQAYSKRSNN